MPHARPRPAHPSTHPAPCLQRATDVVRKLIYGDVDLGIVGYDMLAEIGNHDPGEPPCCLAA